jgi:hypothetical protein
MIIACMDTRRHISKTYINMADGGKFGGKRRRELKEEKKYICSVLFINRSKL